MSLKDTLTVREKVAPIPDNATPITISEAITIGDFKIIGFSVYIDKKSSLKKVAIGITPADGRILRVHTASKGLVGIFEGLVPVVKSEGADAYAGVYRIERYETKFQNSAYTLKYVSDDFGAGDRA